jgi:hypothetical protein
MLHLDHEIPAHQVDPSVGPRPSRNNVWELHPEQPFESVLFGVLPTGNRAAGRLRLWQARSSGESNVLHPLPSVDLTAYPEIGRCADAIEAKATHLADLTGLASSPARGDHSSIVECSFFTSESVPFSSAAYSAPSLPPLPIE